jgi:hypothetical protein
MNFFRTAPTYSEPLQKGNNTSASWYRWMQNIDQGLPPSSETVITGHISPFTYQAPSAGFAIVHGGTVSSIQFARTSGTFHATEKTAGVFPMSQNDQLQITFSVIPSLVFVPQ